MNKHLKKLKKIEDSDEGVNVEDILKLLPIGDATWIEPLKAFATQAQWYSINKENFVPLLAWVEMVCIYFEAGFDGLCRVIEKKDDKALLALGTIEEFQTVEALEHLVLLGKNDDFLRDSSTSFLKKYAYTLNQISHGVPHHLIAVSLHDDLSKLLKALIEHAKMHQEDAMMASAIVCLGNCGTLEDIDFLKKLPPLDFPYKGIEKKMIRKIQKNHA